MRDALSDLLYQSSTKVKRHSRYVDIRIEVSERKVAVAENGMDKFSGEEYSFAFGMQVLTGGNRPRRAILENCWRRQYRNHRDHPWRAALVGQASLPLRLVEWIRFAVS